MKLPNAHPHFMPVTSIAIAICRSAWAEFGTVYRWEKSGELGGMTRVRGFTQGRRAICFCTEEQVAPELLGCLELVKIVLGTLGMSDYRVSRRSSRSRQRKSMSAKPSSGTGPRLLASSRQNRSGFPSPRKPGEAAFYGPKIDFVVRDVIGREWQLGTVQVDYQLPERFDLTYVGADNKPHRPVMIHRAPFGSMERFYRRADRTLRRRVSAMAGAGADRGPDHQREIQRLRQQSGKSASNRPGFGLNPGSAAKTIKAKIRDASMEKIPYMLIVGEKEAG